MDGEQKVLNFWWEKNYQVIIGGKVLEEGKELEGGWTGKQIGSRKIIQLSNKCLLSSYHTPGTV